MDNEFEVERQKIKEKELNRLSSMFRTSVHGFFPDLSLAWFELSRVKLCRNVLKGNKNYFELAGGSSYRGFDSKRG